MEEQGRQPGQRDLRDYARGSQRQNPAASRTEKAEADLATQEYPTVGVPRQARTAVAQAQAAEEAKGDQGGEGQEPHDGRLLDREEYAQRALRIAKTLQAGAGLDAKTAAKLASATLKEQGFGVRTARSEAHERADYFARQVRLQKALARAQRQLDRWLTFRDGLRPRIYEWQAWQLRLRRWSWWRAPRRRDLRKSPRSSKAKAPVEPGESELGRTTVATKPVMMNAPLRTVLALLACLLMMMMRTTAAAVQPAALSSPLGDADARQESPLGALQKPRCGADLRSAQGGGPCVKKKAAAGGQRPRSCWGTTSVTKNRCGDLSAPAAPDQERFREPRGQPRGPGLLLVPEDWSPPVGSLPRIELYSNIYKGVNVYCKYPI